MPLAGRQPKPAGTAVTRHKPAHDWTLIPNVRHKGPPLPKTQADGRPWHPWTRRWWKAISTMPHASLFSDNDWEYVYATLQVAAKFHEASSEKIIAAAAELRQREAILGVTYESRLKLRIRYVDPTPAADEPEVARIDDYRTL